MLIKFIYDKYYYYYKNSKKYNRLFKSKPQLIIILPFQISKIINSHMNCWPNNGTFYKLLV